MRTTLLTFSVTFCALAGGGLQLAAADDLPPVSARFKESSVQEVPNFQKHVVPLFGRLGCNGRACHGSFQGRGGFRLSLFGYDFKADHDALFDKDSPRVDTAKPLESLIIYKPTDADVHEGGQRYEKGSWQYHVIRRWIEGGAKFEEGDVQKLATLQVTPAEMEFSKAGQTAQLKAVAVWEDGSREDVTPLCRFQTNDDQVAAIEQSGLVTAAKSGDTHIVVSYDKAVITVPVIRPVSELIGAKYPATPAPTKIDELVLAKLQKLGIVQSDLCSDAEFLRRVSLDIAGSLPTADEVRAFVADNAPDKRQKKVDELLETPAYAAWWTTKLCDFTGNNDEKLNNVGGIRGQATKDWWNWIYRRVAENTPYDQLAAGIILGKSREEGESYLDYCKAMSEIAQDKEGRSYAERSSMPYYWARTNVRQPEERAIAFAYSFMGARIECAQCHKHPFDQWSKNDFDRFKGFFATVVTGNNNNNLKGEDREAYDVLAKEVGIGDRRMNNGERQRLIREAINNGKTVPFPEIYVNRARGGGNKNQNANNRRPAPPSATAKILGGKELDLSEFEDARQPVMDWLRDKNNGYFARSFANRVWANYFNIGIVNPTDDLNLANPPSNQALLNYLTEGFINSGFDMKWLHRQIANSRTYQLSWVTNDTNKLDERNFSHAIPRRLPAEVAVDVVYQATVADERASSMRTEIKSRAIAIPGASARNNRNAAQFALAVFGRSTRESNCDCDRSMEASLLQTVYLQNDMEVRSKLEARDSWINEVTKKLAKEKQVEGAKDKSDSIDASLTAEIEGIERKLERATKQNNEGQIKRLEALLDEKRKELAATEWKGSEERKVEESKEIDSAAAQTLVETAYLRTLSRYPTADELAIATKYIATEGDLTSGLCDVMWALLNTKEFIVNH